MVHGFPVHSWLAAMLTLLLALSGSSGCTRDTSDPTTAEKQRSFGRSAPRADEVSPDESALQEHESEDEWPETDFFHHVTERVGVSFAFESGRSAGEYAILESLGGGVGAVDYDRDGQTDLMFAGGGGLDNQRVTARPCALYRNSGTGTFELVTDLAGVAADEFYNHGIFPADFDHDGFPDLAVSGYGGVQLFQNQGDGTFRKLPTLFSHAELPWSTSLAWGDFNGNGDLDLYIAHYVDWSWENHPHCPGPRGVPREVCAPREFRGLTDAIYFSDGSGEFLPPRESVGLVAEGKGLGVTAGDVNGDGFLDIYVANDTTDNFLYLNDGTGNFRETAIIAGVSGDDVGVNTGSMGVLMADLQGNAQPDIWVTNFERELFGLYRNEGGGLFSHVSRSAGLAVLGGLYVGFGTVAIDIDFDGHLDLIVANGHVSYHSEATPLRQRPLVIRNLGKGRFRLLEQGGYFAQEHTGRGLAYADLNNDGAWELIFTNVDEPVAILEGREPPHDGWLMVRLVGCESNRDAVGATVRMRTRDGERLWMHNGGGSYLSQSDSRLLLVAPPGDDVQEARVRWPSGREEAFPFPRGGNHVLWREGSGRDIL
jgi:enediyne biosynthesis protein E4